MNLSLELLLQGMCGELNKEQVKYVKRAYQEGKNIEKLVAKIRKEINGA